MENNKQSLALQYGLTILGILTRVLPHPPNMTALTSVSLFSATYGTRKTFWIVPIVAMIVSDAIIGFYTWQIMVSVYVSFLIIGLIGFVFLRKNRTLPKIIGCALAGSFIFYLITNFAVWAWSPMYQKTWIGLAQSYILALPFLKNMAIGDLIYTIGFFSIYEWYRTRYALKKSLTHSIAH